MKLSTGLPSQRCSGGMAPGAIPPLKRLPTTKAAALAQFGKEAVELREVVGIIGIPHDDEAPARSRDAADERRAITLLHDWDDTSAELPRDLLGAVRRAIVGDEDLAFDATPPKIAEGLLDAGADRFGLVQAGHQDGQLGCGGVKAHAKSNKVAGQAKSRARIEALLNLYYH